MSPPCTRRARSVCAPGSAPNDIPGTFQRCRAFAMPNNRIGAIQAQDRGARSRWRGAPSEADALLDGITEELDSLVDPRTGLKLVRRIDRADTRLGNGAFKADARSAGQVPNRHRSRRARVFAPARHDPRPECAAPLCANRRPRAAKPRVDRDSFTAAVERKVTHGNVLDLAPTILSLLDIAPAPHMAGRILHSDDGDRLDTIDAPPVARGIVARDARGAWSNARGSASGGASAEAALSAMTAVTPTPASRNTRRDSELNGFMHTDSMQLVISGDEPVAGKRMRRVEAKRQEAVDPMIRGQLRTVGLPALLADKGSHRLIDVGVKQHSAFAQVHIERIAQASDCWRGSGSRPSAHG